MKGIEKDPLVVRCIQKIAPEVGLKAYISPELEYMGQLTSADGRVRYMQGSSFDINPRSASEVAGSKAGLNFFLDRLGYPTIQGRHFSKVNQDLEACIAEAYAYAQELGFPVYIKPNSLSQGIGVAKVMGREDFVAAALFILQHDNSLLVQETVTGGDYRIIVLDDQVICAYQRIPLTIVGDGVQTVGQLLKKRHQEIQPQGARVDLYDARIQRNLATLGLQLDSILEEGQSAILLDNANLSSGGRAIDVSTSVHPAFKKLAVALTKDAGLRYCGVDLLIDPDITDEQAAYKVVELNAAPGLDNFAALGEKQMRVVEDHYRLIVQKMFAVLK